MTDRDAFRAPAALYERLDREFGFRLDAACDAGNQLAPIGLGPKANGLIESWVEWSAGRPVWLNPPYSNIGQWVKKAAREGQAVTVVVLLPVNTSSSWWHRFVAREATSVRFLTGRLTFEAPDGGRWRCPMSHAVVVFSPAGGPPHYTYTSPQPAAGPMLPLGAGHDEGVQ